MIPFLREEGGGGGCYCCWCCCLTCSCCSSFALYYYTVIEFARRNKEEEGKKGKARLLRQANPACLASVQIDFNFSLLLLLLNNNNLKTLTSIAVPDQKEENTTKEGMLQNPHTQKLKKGIRGDEIFLLFFDCFFLPRSCNCSAK